MLFTYTVDTMYREIGSTLSSSNFDSLINYLTSIFYNIRHYQDMYYNKEPKPDLKWMQSPVFRGVRPGCINLKDYSIGSIQFWPKLTSTSKLRKIADGFTLPLEKVIFAIYLTKENSPV
jgi:hypothetical protein